MSIFKIGDEFVILRDSSKINGFDSGDHVVLIGFEKDGCHKFKSKKNGKILYFFEEGVKKIESSSFKTSNRYKLHKYILSTGFTKQDLSLALNKKESYLSVETRESQFTNRGDMSDVRYKSLRKQIKEAVQIKSEPAYISLVTSEITQTLAEIKPKEKDMSKDTSFIGCSWSELSNTFDYQPNQKQEEKTIDEKVKEAKEALDTFTAPKPPNNGAFILGLVFFVMLIIFGIGCLIYKAA